MSRSVYITDTAAFLPNDPVGNERMEHVLGQVGPRPSRARRTILRSNGIRNRHYAIDPNTGFATHSNAALTAAAIQQLARDADFDLAQLGCLSCGTSIPDQLMPNHAVMVQGELQLPTLEVVATSGICVSGMSALKYAWMAVASGQHDTAIATGSELSSSVLCARNFVGEVGSGEGEAAFEAGADQLERRPELAFEKDFLRWMLSDGAGAALLRVEPVPDQLNLRVDWLDLFSYAGEMETCMYAGAIKNDDGALTGWATLAPERRNALSVLAVKQDVKLLNDHVVHYTVEKPLKALQHKRNLKASEIDWFLPHYSSNYFRDRVLEGLRNADFEIPQSRWFTNLTECGNTGAASMFIMLDELRRSGRIERGQRLLCWVPESGRFSAALMHLTAV